MAYERDAYERDRDQAHRSDPAAEESRDARRDIEFQANPELAESRAGGTRITLFAVAIAVLLGVVFYGLNNSAVETDGANTPASSNTAERTKPPVAPGVRDVTPGPNGQPGVTTGAAPAKPAQPAQPGPTGTRIDRPAGSPPDNGGAK